MFAAGEERWRARLGTVRQVVRQELVARQLATHVRPPAEVLDIGCGQGTQSLRLARGGCRVTGLDTSSTMLADFQRALAAEPPPVRERVRLVHGDATEAHGTFDAVLCHGVLMYFDDPDPVLRAIAASVVPGGIVSLLVRNGDALAMRPALLGDWQTAEAAFDTTTYANRIGVTARADRLANLTTRLDSHGLTVRTWYGVRVLTDTAADDAPPPPDLDALLACEQRAGATDPYRGVAPLLHVIAENVAQG